MCNGYEYKFYLQCVSQDYHVINSIVETKYGVAKDQLLRKSNGECLKEDQLLYFPVPGSNDTLLNMTYIQ